jgi:hypothetical protein
MIVYAIKRDDGKYYTGKGQKTWRSDPSWKLELNSASLYKPVYLNKALIKVGRLLEKTKYLFKIVKVKIEEVEE